MPNFFDDNADLTYYIDRGINWRPLVDLVEHGLNRPDGFKTVDEAITAYRDLVETMGAFAAEEVAPHAAEIEKQGLIFDKGEVITPPRLTEVIEKLRQLGVLGLATPRELGGMHCPNMLFFITTELLSRADIVLLPYAALNAAILEALLHYSIIEGSTDIDPATGTITKTRWADAMAEIIHGDASGSMDITEANAGSDMAALRTKAELDENGQWFITGEKIFITSGNGKYHLVVARSEDPKNAPGLKGLSLFFVRAYHTDAAGQRQRTVRVERLEPKLGQHSTSTCVITFDRTPAELIGKRGQGFALMLSLMNGARVGVGFAALGIAESAYRLASSYAAERMSMGKPIDHHEIIADYLDEMRTDLQAIRALAMDAAYHQEMAVRLDVQTRLSGHSDDQMRSLASKLRHHQHEARKTTPLLKYLAAEKAVDTARRTIQILGAVGYSCEYPAERLLRDALAMPIYEGTSQIQALMAMKDALGGILKNPREFVRHLAQTRWRSVSARDGLERRVARLTGHGLAAEQHLLSRTAADKIRSLAHEPITSWPRAFFKQWDLKRDFTYALLHAERLTAILADTKIAEILWLQAKQHPERREVLERHLERAEVRVRALLDQITSTGARLIAGLNPQTNTNSSDRKSA